MRVVFRDFVPAINKNVKLSLNSKHILLKATPGFRRETVRQLKKSKVKAKWCHYSRVKPKEVLGNGK